tara:strand:+ start:397 stop:1386 length:990 start_codon:yes stop_codon:yes gene_type:complete
MKKILLIGGEGYIGRVITSYFLKLGYKVTSIDNYIYGINNYAKEISHTNYTFINTGMSNIQIIKKYIIEADNIVLLGGLVGDPITKKYPELSNEINNTSVKNIIDICMQVEKIKFIFISTCSNYGLIPEDIKADEDYRLEPLSLYAKSKVSAENHIMSYKNKTLAIPTILRFATAFGLSERMRFDLTVNQFVKELKQNEELIVFDENTWRPYCHVVDFARAIEAVINSDINIINFEIFNCGSDKNNYTKKMIVDEVHRHINKGKVIYRKNDGDPRNYRVNFQKIKSQLFFETKYSIGDGIVEISDALDGNIFDFDSDCEFGNYKIPFNV